MACRHYIAVDSCCSSTPLPVDDARMRGATAAVDCRTTASAAAVSAAAWSCSVSCPSTPLSGTWRSTPALVMFERLSLVVTWSDVGRVSAAYRCKTLATKCMKTFKNVFKRNKNVHCMSLTAEWSTGVGLESRNIV